MLATTKSHLARNLKRRMVRVRDDYGSPGTASCGVVLDNPFVEKLTATALRARSWLCRLLRHKIAWIRLSGFRERFSFLVFRIRNLGINRVGIFRVAHSSLLLRRNSLYPGSVPSLLPGEGGAVSNSLDARAS